MSKPPHVPEYLYPHEVAAMLHTTRGALDQWRHQGGGPPYIKAGRFVLYPKAWLDRWLAQHKTYPKAP